MKCSEYSTAGVSVYSMTKEKVFTNHRIETAQSTGVTSLQPSINRDHEDQSSHGSLQPLSLRIPRKTKIDSQRGLRAVC